MPEQQMVIAVSAAVNLPHFGGWHLIGAFLDNEPDDVGSWLLVNNGEAVLLEIPPGLSVRDVKSALKQTRTSLRSVTASHDHEDHLDPDAWEALRKAFPNVEVIRPSTVSGDHLSHIGGEPLYLIKAPKHSWNDVVAVFRGVAMTGDIELGMLASVNNEVPWPTKMRSMDWLRRFPDRAGYHVHSVVSAHLNDVRVAIRWPDLFSYEDAKRKFCRRCGGRLVPIEPDFAGFDRKCENCGRTEWSDPRKK
jgi:hypothetical protein